MKGTFSSVTGQGDALIISSFHHSININGLRDDDSDTPLLSPLEQTVKLITVMFIVDDEAVQEKIGTTRFGDLW